MSRKKVAVLLVGINGYGQTYLRELLSDKYDNAYLAGAISTNPKRSNYYAEIKQREIPICGSIEEFYKHHKADLTIISTPIHLHKEQSIFALENGSNVLCEKPTTANPKDINEMVKARDRTGKFLAIGFNWSFTPQTQKLKSDILNGKFGKTKRLKTIVQWPRNNDYYNRSSWAGKKYSPDGDMIFDSVANNAAAHYLHHLFYLTGDTIETSAQIDELTAELYKVNDIETFDTCTVKIKTTSNTDILFIASHAVHEKRKPNFVLEFEKATITYDPEKSDKGMVATFNDGTTIEYGDPEVNKDSKIPVCIDAVYKGNQKILCGIEASTPHVQSIAAMHQSVPNVAKFPSEITKHDKEKKLTWVEGLNEILVNCYENWSLPNDLGVEWSKKGKTIQVNN